MKKVLLLVFFSLFLSGCSYFSKQDQAAEIEMPHLDSSALISTEPVLDGNIQNLLVRNNSFGTEEITVLKDEVLILNIRNQQEEPINVVIDQLGIRSEQISFGEAVEVTIPTNKIGEFEMYSSLGNQRKEGFSALIVIEEGLEDL